MQDGTELDAALNDRAAVLGMSRGQEPVCYAALVLPVCQAVKQRQSSSSAGLPVRKPLPRPKAGGSWHLEKVGVDFTLQQRAVPHKSTMKDQQRSSIFCLLSHIPCINE